MSRSRRMSKKKKTNSQPVIVSQEQGHWDELPLEVVEMFLGYVSNNNQLLSLRLVSKVWNDAASSVMQRRSHAIVTKWDSNDSSEIFPTLTILEKHGLSLAFYPRGTTPLPRGYNPFVTKSLVLSTSGSDGNGRTFQNTKEKKRISIYYLLQRNGDCLTSLQIFGAKIDPMELYKLLQQVPNLKALKLGKLRFEGEGEKTGVSLPLVSTSNFLNFLTHVFLRIYSPTVNQWLLNLFGPQLVNLDFVHTEGILPFNQTNYTTTTSKGSKPFQNLKNLKIIAPNRDFVLNTGVHFSWPLERLLIDFMWSSDLSVDDFIQLITRFATSLTDLRFNCGSIRDVAASSKLSKLVTFPRLSRFDFNVIDLERFELVKRHMLPRFTKLETLGLSGFDHRLFKDQASRGVFQRCNNWEYDFFEREGLWNLCPNLKAIEVNGGCVIEGLNVFTRQLRDGMI